jgi:hypothetical protein
VLLIYKFIIADLKNAKDNCQQQKFSAAAGTGELVNSSQRLY